MNCAMARHQRIRIPLRRKMPVTAIAMSGSLRDDAPTRWDPVQPPRVGRRTGNSPDRWPRRCIDRQASVAIAIAADVDPLQSIGRPHPAPAAVIGGVGVGSAKERKAMAVMEEAVMMERGPENRGANPHAKSRGESAACAKRAPAKWPPPKRMPPPMPPPCIPPPHAAAMHAASHAAAMPPPSATATADRARTPVTPAQAP